MNTEYSEEKAQGRAPTKSKYQRFRGQNRVLSKVNNKEKVWKNAWLSFLFWTLKFLYSQAQEILNNFITHELQINWKNASLQTANHFVDALPA